MIRSVRHAGLVQASTAPHVHRHFGLRSSGPDTRQRWLLSLRLRRTWN